MALLLAGVAALTVSTEAIAQAAQGGWRKEVADKVQAAQTAGKKR